MGCITTVLILLLALARTGTSLGMPAQSLALCVAPQAECSFVESFGLATVPAASRGGRADTAAKPLVCFQSEADLNLYREACQRLVNLREATRQLEGDVAVLRQLNRLEPLAVAAAAAAASVLSDATPTRDETARIANPSTPSLADT